MKLEYIFHYTEVVYRYTSKYFAHKIIHFLHLIVKNKQKKRFELYQK